MFLPLGLSKLYSFPKQAYYLRVIYHLSYPKPQGDSERLALTVIIQVYSKMSAHLADSKVVTLCSACLSPLQAITRPGSCQLYWEAVVQTDHRYHGSSEEILLSLKEKLDQT